MKFSVTNVLIAVAMLFVGRCTADLPPPPVITHIVRDTVAPAALVDSVRVLRLTADGLKAKLADRHRLAPDTVLVTDMLVTPPDTVLQAVALSNGRLSLAPLIRDTTLWRPELHRYDVSRCDDGFSWAAGDLVCDRSRFGHLSPFVGVGVEYDRGYSFGAAAGVAWKRSNVSPWTVGLEIYARGRAELGIVREWQLF